MKNLFLNRFAQIALTVSICLLATVFAFAETSAPPVLIKGVTGLATYSTDGKSWNILKNETLLDHDAVIKTGASGSVDFILQYSSTVMRLTPNSELELTRLNRLPAGEVVVTDTTLKLVSGSILGSQRKLSNPSRFKIMTSDGVARIIGTEYLVRADGAVTVLSGTVTLNYNLPKNGGTVKATVGPGESFNPATGTVTATTPAFLKNIIADVDSMRNNAETYKVGKATVVVKHKDGRVTKHDCDDDDEDHGGDHGGDDHGNNNGHGNGNGNGHGKDRGRD